MSNAMQLLLSRASGEVIIMDGGMGSTVEDRGVYTHSPLWGSYAFLTEEGRAITEGIHRDFVAAGAEILIANDHNSTRWACNEFLEKRLVYSLPLPPQVAKAREDDQVGELQSFLVQEAMDTARRTIPPGQTIAVTGCIGSVEGPYSVESRVTADEAAGMLEIEIEARRPTSPDLIIFETLTTPSEIQGAARAARNQGLTGFGVGLACGEDGKTLGGVSMAEVAETFSRVDPDVYFIQCTRFDLVERALNDLKRALGPGKVTGVYANDGRRWDPEKMCWSGNRIPPEDYGQHAVRWADAGARIIGGCCGTMPEHIAYLKKIFSSKGAT